MVNERMKADLQELGLKADDTILMHSSLSSLGYVEGGAETVIDTLLDVLKDGTLLLPAFSFDEYTLESRKFSIQDTPSCVGCISEYFRKREGVIRSMHPTHSVCGIGKYAKEILEQHINTDTPVGPGSPPALLPEYHGKILMLGCSLRSNTSMHGVEELSRPWYLFKDRPEEFELTDENGVVTRKSYLCHNFAGVIQRYDRMNDLIHIACGKVLNAKCYLMSAEEVWKAGNAKLKEDEQYFIDFRREA